MENNPNFYINIHSHRKKMLENEIVLRNYLIPRMKANPDKIDYSITVGIHPWWALLRNFHESIHQLESHIENQNVLAIGEIGLDRAKNQSFDDQILLFNRQLEMAKYHQLPVIIHCVRAYSDIISRIKSFSSPVIFHDYHANEIITKQLLKFENVYFSLGKRLMKKDPSLMKSLALLPLNRLFFETDTMNENIDRVYLHYAHLQNLKVSEIQENVFKNFQRVFPPYKLEFLFKK